MLLRPCRRALLGHFASSASPELSVLSYSTSTPTASRESAPIQVPKLQPITHRRRKKGGRFTWDSQKPSLLTRMLEDRVKGPKETGHEKRMKREMAEKENLDKEKAQVARPNPDEPKLSPHQEQLIREFFRAPPSHPVDGFVPAQWKDELAPGKDAFGTPVMEKKRKKKDTRRENITFIPNEKSRMERDPPPHGPAALEEVEGMLSPLEGQTLTDIEQLQPRPPIETLEHGLDRVLFNPGVHWLQDKRSRVYNFPPELEKVPQVSDFDFDRVTGFIPSSRDNTMRALAQREGMRFTGSTSSLSGVLSHCYFLISDTKEVFTHTLSGAFKNQPKTFSPAQRFPASVILNYKDGVYGTDADKGSDVPEKNILTWLGTLLEKYLTASPKEFSRYMKNAPPLPPDETQKPEAYRYSKSRHFVMRSQLDCVDSRLPGTGVFDIKTRACVATRLDILNYQEHTGYQIKYQQGLVESFEKEYYDLIRSAFLKYSFQARIGNMDGIFVAYHNVGKLFGFQYIPLLEMDTCLYGVSQPGVGDRIFQKCIGLMEEVMHEVVDTFKEQSVKATFETKEDTTGMNVWIEPLEWDGAEEDRPIEQLRVEVTSYLDADPVKGLRAAFSDEGEWTLRYKIQRLDMTQATKKRNLSWTRERQNPTFLIPSHVDEDELEQYWRTLCHGNGKPDEGPFDPTRFTQPPPSIESLRKLSRKGKQEEAEESELYKDQPVVRWSPEREES